LVPAYSDYLDRMLDFGFQLQALATLAWLQREHPGEPITDALLQSRPESLRSPTRSLRVTDDGLILEVPLRSSYDQAPWHVPLRPAAGAP
jgi:hypothetical protein